MAWRFLYIVEGIGQMFKCRAGDFWWCDAMEIFGIVIPLWAVFIGVILLIVILWKLIKFALKVLIIVIVFFAILIGLDLIGVFDYITNFVSTFL